LTSARAKLIEGLNQTAESEGAKITFEGPLAFGGSEVLRYRLGNGLRVRILIDKSAPVVTYFTWFGVGSRHEKPGKTGLAHLFEHLMFNETESLKAGEFDRKLEENGAVSNAATWLDWTYYHEALPADRLGLAIKLESDRMAHLVLREPQVKSEKEVVANERRYRVEDDVEGAASELLYKTAYTVHPYHWPTIGWMEDIQNFSPEDCADFYRTYYAPNNALVVVVGDVREKDALTKIRDGYGKIESSQVPPEDTQPEPPQTEERRVKISKPTATEKLFIGFHGPAIGDSDHAHLTLLNEILFGGRASRLHRAMIIDEEVASDLRGWVATFRDPGLYEMHLTARPEKTAARLEEILARELTRAKTEVVSEDELLRAKARLELSALQSLDTMSGKAEQIGFYETVMGDAGACFRRLDEYRRVTQGDILRAARRYLVDRARTTIHVVPEETSAEAAE